MANQLDLDLDRIATALLYLTVGRAVVDFPTTTAAHPSYWVTVSLTVGGPILKDDAHRFPMSIQWDVWQNVVVALWEDPTWQFRVTEEVDPNLRIALNEALVNLQAYDEMLTKIRALLLSRYIERGYIPKEAEPEGFVPTPPAPGAPITPPSEQPATYKRFDC